MYVELEMSRIRRARENMPTAVPAENQSNRTERSEEPADDEENATDQAQELQQGQSEIVAFSVDDTGIEDEEHEERPQVLTEIRNLNPDTRTSLAGRLTEIIPLRENLRACREKLASEGATVELAAALTVVFDDLDKKAGSSSSNPFYNVIDPDDRYSATRKIASSSYFVAQYETVEAFAVFSIKREIDDLASDLANLKAMRAQLEEIHGELAPEALATALTDDPLTPESLTETSWEVKRLEESVKLKSRSLNENLGKLQWQLDDLGIERLSQELKQVTIQEHMKVYIAERRARVNKRRAIIDALPVEKRRNTIALLREQVEKISALPPNEKSEALQQQQEEIEELLLQIG